MNAQDLRAGVQGFVRRFGLLAPDRTPCGEALPPATAHALLHLLAADPAPTQQDLVDALGLDKSNVARLCQRLERAGHLTRVVDADDRRARRVRLTAKGHRLASRVDASSRARFDAVFAALSVRDRSVVVDALARLTAAIDVVADERVSA
ncbi:MAG: MarR family winged helix-turn-helix transcriptional regulator [Deltaproteobacteria bacterium]